MATLGAMVRQGWRWWVGELAGMVPVSWRMGQAPAVILSPTGDASAPFRLIGKREGMSMERLSARDRKRAVIAVDRRDILCRTLDTPAMSAADTRAMLAFDLDRLTPFPSGTACFDFEMQRQSGTAGTASILLGVLPMARARDWYDVAVAADIVPQRIAMIDADGRLRFNFLPAMGVAGGRAGHKALLWTIVVILFVCNIGMLILRDVASVEALRDAVEEQAPAGRTAMKLRARLEEVHARRIALVRDRQSHEPLRVLAAISAALPAGAWVQRLSWDGRELRIVGYAGAQTDIGEALRQEPLLTNIRENEVTDTGAGGGAAQPFDVSMAVRPGNAT